ncbi:MAG: transaldolase, partial [Spirochaetales bacterium]|nr:transaldolase [Spirochaetales bacterium]
IDPAYLDLAGVAAMKKAVQIFKEKGYRTRLLTAAYRNQLHWSELIGGNIIHTIPYKWQQRYNNSDVEIKNTTDEPIDPKVIKGLSDKFEDFRKAYDPQGIAPEDFENYGATKRTLKGFIAGYSQLVEIIRDLMIPGV